MDHLGALTTGNMTDCTTGKDPEFEIVAARTRLFQGKVDKLLLAVETDCPGHVQVDIVDA